MPSAPRRERKVVSVVFCDLVGFTQQAETLDPEDIEAFLDPYHQHLRSVLEHHGGTVEKFIGDAVMALFGAPVAHEDDPERAVRAALVIRDWAVENDEVQVRLGVTTGEAVIRLDARPEAGEGMASGDVVNTAARLQAAAPVNAVLVDETTYRASRHVIEHDDAAPVEAKGKAEPIPVWLARQARTRFGIDVAHQARAELVGRERELALLRDAFERAVHQRTPQLVTLVGVPGIGKSRLVYELSAIARDDPELITWRQGRCLAYGEGVTLWALGEILKAQVGILEQDSPGEVDAKIRTSVEAMLNETDARWVEQHLRALVGLAEETDLGGDRRGEAFAAWRRFLERLAELGPLVLVFEDLHWADASLLDFVDELVDWLTDVPLLVVGTARPELLERRHGWGGGKLNATTLALAPLSDEQTAHLLSALLDRPVLAAESQRALLERAGGNPLYAEQFADLYVERGSTKGLALPETLQGIIAARLDGLAREEKGLLQDAAVIGKVFWAGGLQRASEDAGTTLHSLERKGFVRRQRRSSVEGESEFAFAHALVRDVAYGQIPRADRATKHRRVAEWIESLGRPEDHAEMLAYHWGSALELARASGTDAADLVERTRLALRDAGDRAFGLNAFSTAASYYEHALGLWSHDPERPQLLFRLANALYIADDDRAEAALEEAREALLGAADRDSAAEAELALSRIWWNRGDSEQSNAHEARAEELVGAASSPVAARVLAHIARSRVIGGHHPEALPLAREALALAEGFRMDDVRAHALATVGLAKIYLGDPTGRDDEVRALELATAANSPVAGAIANNVAVNAFFDFDLPGSSDLIDEALRLAERIGDASGARFLRGHRPTYALLLGKWDEAVELADEFIRECETGSPHYMETRARIARGEIRLARGDAEGALKDFEHALTLVRSMSDPQAIMPVLASAYAAYETYGKSDETRPLLAQLVRLASDNPMEAAITLAFDVAYAKGAVEYESELRAAVDRAPPWRWRDVARMCLDGEFVRAADTWAEGGSPTQEARLRLRASEDFLTRGRVTEAQEQATNALAFYRTVGATFFIHRAEEFLPVSA
jgi:class 3 adenylate cyclase/tetratricopeptide (TPR) repeat protein